MKKVFCILVCFCLVIGLCGSVLAESSNEAKKPSTITSQPTPIKEANLPIEDDQPDEVQRQYMFRLMDINLELKYAYLTLLKNFQFTRNQQKRENAELRYRGYVPRDVKEEMKEIKDEKSRMEDKRRNLERDKKNLKLDALKYYRGKMPKWLYEKWNEEERRHNNYLDNDFTQEMKKELKK